MKLKLNIIKYFLLITAVFFAAPVFASQFSFDTPNGVVQVGGQLEVDLNINTDKESINAVEGNIIFSTSTLDLSEIRDGNSIVNFWVNKPANENGIVSFSGITPGGFVLDKGLILSLIFMAKKEGDATIEIKNASALENDGKGTASSLQTSDLNIEVASSSQNLPNQNLAISDNTPPENFKPEVARDSNLFNGKWFAVFVAQDKGSGIAKYEIKESKFNIFDFSKWNDATSPYVLSDQKLQSYIFVKAIDNSGNERIVKLSPENPIPWYENIEDWFIIAVVIAIVALIYFFSKKKVYRA